jgi:hypothetical protein
MFGLAAIAAVAAMAFVGATSASASSTLLCSSLTTGLTPNAAECNSPSELHFVSVGKAVLLTPNINVECNALIQSTRTSAALAAPVTFNGTLKYESCSSGCTVKQVKEGTISILKTAPELADVTATGYVVNVNCLFGSLNCDYDATNLVGHGLGADVAGTEGKGHVTYSGNVVNAKEKLGGFIGCPTVSELDALFQSLTSLYIRA